MKNSIFNCRVCGLERKSATTFMVHFNKHHADDISLIEYLIKYGVYTEKMCGYCNTRCKLLSLSEGFHEICGKEECINKYKKDRTEEAMLNKYGVKNAAHLPGYSEKVKKTKLERYGDENYTNPEKMKRTCVDRYGNISYTGTDEYKEKYKQTCLEKYGVEYHTQNSEFKEKVKNSNIKKYGIDHPWKCPEILTRRTNTVIEKYGGYTFASPELSEKARQTMIDRYGFEYATQIPGMMERIMNTNLERYGNVFPPHSKKLLMEKYGVETVHEIEGILDRQKINRLKTVLHKYQVTNVSKLPIVREKARNTTLERYGKEYYIQTEFGKEHIKNSLLEKYGVDNPMKYEEFLIKCLASNTRKKYRIKKYNTTFGDEIHYQSDLELKFIKKCEKSNIRILDGDMITYHHNQKDKTYYVDFKIYYDNKWQLIEIKAPHKWYYESIEDGTLESKMMSAKQYSEENHYHNYCLVMPWDMIDE